MLSRRQFIATALNLGALGGCKRQQAEQLPEVHGETSAARAIEAARRFSGTTLNVAWEDGMQAQELLQFSGPMWERLTGIRVNTLPLGPPTNVYRRVFLEHQAASGALDCGMIAPAWVPDLLLVEALEPLDRYVEHYMVAGDLADMLPLYRSFGTWDGRRYGLFDDGDVLLVYYRDDLFRDEVNQREFLRQFGHPLGDPRSHTWQHFVDAAQFFTEKYAPGMYGLAPFNRDLRWGWFQAMLRRNGGQFFDPRTMVPQVGAEPGLRTMSDLAKLDRFMPPGVGDIAPKEAVLTAYASGSAAMASYWPPLGRFVESYGVTTPRHGGLPPTRTIGKTRYAFLPGGVTEMALGYLLCVFARSRQKEAAYLFVQWLNSPEISLRRVMLPSALRDPFRISHVQSKEYRERWPRAPEYLDRLAAAATESVSFVDLIMPGHADYADGFFAAITDVRLGMDVSDAMARMVARWEAITERYGREAQQAAYANYLRRPGATLDAQEL